VVVPGPDEAQQVRADLPGVEVLCGEQGLIALAAQDGVDVVLNALVGAVGLRPTLAAVEAGRTVAMANKEPLVMAGGLILERARERGAVLLPLDSEPNALWQCLNGESVAQVRRLILTASGGPFRGRTLGQMRAVTPAQALDHPTWKMGPKITVDSATLMNKGFEVLEASWLFGVDLDRIEVLVHPESVVHSMVEFADGAILAHLGQTDMSLPIQYALTHPERRPSALKPLELAQLGRLSFAAPDRASFPCLDLCYQAGRMGGTAPAVLNAADEVAVAGFLEGRIGFGEIPSLALQALEACRPGPADSVEAVLEADLWARRLVAGWVERGQAREGKSAGR
jgi:1-deoxy-D-xylulose-5-phosphate reductoisomerase